MRLLHPSRPTLLADPRARRTQSLPPAPWANRQLPDPRQEAQAQALMEELRCLVCQGQSIADSDAELAGDMRALVRERIAAGETPERHPRLAGRALRRLGQLSPPVEPLTWPLVGGADPAARRRRLARCAEGSSDERLARRSRLLVAVTLGVLWLARLRGAMLQLAAAALLFGAAGYALQGRPGLAGSPRTVAATRPRRCR